MKKPWMIWVNKSRECPKNDNSTVKKWNQYHQTWMWYSIGNQYFDDNEKLGKYRNGDNWYRSTHPRALTHWGRVTHISVSKLTTIGSDNGLSSGRSQAIIRANTGILLIGPLETSFGELLIGMLYDFHSRKFTWKCRLPKWRPFCPGGRWVYWTGIQ